MNTATLPKTTRTHRNVSRVVVELDGFRYRFNLTRGGLVIRRWHSHKTKLLSFSAMLDLSRDQRLLL